MTRVELSLVLSTTNILVLAVALKVLAELCLRARDLAHSVKRLKEQADRIAGTDRDAVRQVARLAHDISSDISKLRVLEST
jgi:hypothetical protein